MSFTPQEEREIVENLAVIRKQVEDLSTLASKVETNTSYRNRLNGALVLLTFCIPVYLKFYHKPPQVKQVKPPSAISKDMP